MPYQSAELATNSTTEIKSTEKADGWDSYLWPSKSNYISALNACPHYSQYVGRHRHSAKISINRVFPYYESKCHSTELHIYRKLTITAEIQKIYKKSGFQKKKNKKTAKLH